MATRKHPRRFPVLDAYPSRLVHLPFSILHFLAIYRPGLLLGTLVRLAVEVVEQEVEEHGVRQDQDQ